MFEKFLVGFFWFFRYRHYFKKYGLHDSFKFNGYFILFRGSGRILVGENSYVSYFTNVVVAEDTKITLGSNVKIAHNVRINTESIDASSFIKGNCSLRHDDICIGNNVLIGNNSYIGPGVKIGNNVVVPPNSVVTSNVPDCTIYKGKYNV